MLATALRLPARVQMQVQAQAISQMILYKKSEWFHSKAKRDGLVELIGHSGSTQYLNWVAGIKI